MKYKKIIISFFVISILIGVFFSIYFHSDFKLDRSSKGIIINYIDNGKISSVSNLVPISEEEIWGNGEYIIIEGKVEKVNNIKIRFGSEKEYGALLTVKINNVLRGTIDSAVINIFVDMCFDKGVYYEDAGVLSSVEIGDNGIFIIRKYLDTDVWEENEKILYMNEIAEYGFEDAERFAFVEKGSKVIFSPIYENIPNNSTLSEVHNYIMEQIKERKHYE